MSAQPRAGGALPWDELKHRLDQNAPFNAMRDTPYYRDAVYDQFSKVEYARRYEAVRNKLRQHKLDAVVIPGGPSHWSWGGGMAWLTGHWEWHALASYVLVPLNGEPTMVYSMSGTHCEAIRRVVSAAVTDVRHSRGGKYAEVMIERLRELGLEKGRIGFTEVDPRHSDYPPMNQFQAFRDQLPNAELVLTKGWLHELLSIHSAEELECVRVAGKLCQDAMEAIVKRARPGVAEYQLRAAAGAAIMEGGGDIDFLIIGSTPMDNPAMVFGNPRPSKRILQQGDIINMELAAGYRGYTAQIGSPITVGKPNDMVKRFWEEITLPGYQRMVAEIKPGNPVEKIRDAGKFFREKGVQSRPIHAHGIDIVTDGPHVFCESTHAEPFEETFKPGMVFMPEPNPISADGQFGIFLGHTFIVTPNGHECVDKFPLEIVVAG